MDLTGIARAARAEPAAPSAYTAIVIRADISGLWVAPLGDDTRHPVGPCRGGWTATGSRIPPGQLVMLAHTPDGPWVVALDDPTHTTPAPDPVRHEFARRAAATMTGGGVRTVSTAGAVAWSQPLTVAAAGISATEAPAGRFEIALPIVGTVIPVHYSTGRTSHAVAGSVALDPDEALWYDLPLGQGAAASQPGRFHVLASDFDDGYAVPAHWVLVVRRIAWAPGVHAAEYLWGDGRAQDPWRVPALSGGWVEGTVAPRFTKTGDQVVHLKGRVRSGTGAAFTLPNGYRPGIGGHRAIVPDGADAPSLLTVTADGVLTPSGSNTDHSIETTFVAEQ